MDAELVATPAAANKVPWNKEKIIGSKPPLRVKCWSIRTKLQVERRLRSMMDSQSPSRWRSEMLGQSGPALPSF